MTDDSDETEGRKLYRARADALANAQVAYSKRRIKPINDPGRLVPHHGSGPATVSGTAEVPHCLRRVVPTSQDMSAPVHDDGQGSGAV